MKKPFIHLFKTPNAFYFYDVNRDAIAEIMPETYACLEGKCLWADLPIECINEINKLEEVGFLSDKHITTMQHPDTDSIRYHLDRRIEQITLQVTQSCNLVCGYCPYANTTDGVLQRNHSSKQMDWETAKTSIDFFVKHSVDVDKLRIGFYGGEPFIAFDLIKKCVNYAQEQLLGKRLDFTVTTNGTLLNDEIISFIVENHINVMFSIDGPASIHDENRRFSNGKGSFEYAFANLEKLSNAYGEEAYLHVSINMVLNPEKDPSDILSLFNLEYFQKYQINVMAGIADDTYLDKDWHISEDFLVFMRKWHFICMFKYLKIVDDLEIPPMFQSFVMNLNDIERDYRSLSNELPDIGAPAGPCIPGQRHLFVDTDGVLFPCERVNELSSLMKIGTIKNGIDYEHAAELLNICNLTPEQCTNCYALRHCKVCCGYVEDGDHYCIERRKYMCDESKSLVRSDVRTCALIHEWKHHYMTLEGIK